MKLKKEREYSWYLLSKYRGEMYGIAALMICCFHSQVFLTDLPKIPLLNIDVTYIIHQYFSSGVDIFLLLSGMSLYFLFKKKNPPLKQFYKDRASRVLIPYIVLTIPFFIFKLVTEHDIFQFVLNITGISLFIGKFNGFYVLNKGLFWYIEFIILCYLLFPLIYKFFDGISGKKRLLRLWMLIAVSVVLTLQVRIVSPDFFQSVEILLTRLPVFFLGIYLAPKCFEKQKYSKADFVGVAVCLVVTVLFYFLRHHTDLFEIMFLRWFDLFIAYMFCFLVPIVLEFLHFIPLNNIFAFFGSISMELYITHVMLYQIFPTTLFPEFKKSAVFSYATKVWMYVALICCAILISFLFRLIYDKVLNKIKNSRKNLK